MKIILLNGPPGSGKDTIAKGMRAVAPFRVRVYHFADELKRMTHRAFNISNPESAAQFEHCKDMRRPEFFGVTPRSAYIAMSERFVKPLFGPGYFGKIMVERLKQDNPEIAVIADSGFEEEADELVKAFGPEAITLIRVYRSGCSFITDSRSYWATQTLQEYSVSNDGTLDEIESLAFLILRITA